MVVCQSNVLICYKCSKSTENFHDKMATFDPMLVMLNVVLLKYLDIISMFLLRQGSSRKNLVDIGHHH